MLKPDVCIEYHNPDVRIKYQHPDVRIEYQNTDVRIEYQNSDVRYRYYKASTVNYLIIDNLTLNPPRCEGLSPNKPPGGYKIVAKLIMYKVRQKLTKKINESQFGSVGGRTMSTCSGTL